MICKTDAAGVCAGTGRAGKYGRETMDAQELGMQMLEYCRKFKIPQDYVMDILNDQKVVPMIRGVARHDF